MYAIGYKLEVDIDDYRRCSMKQFITNISLRLSKEINDTHYDNVMIFDDLNSAKLALLSILVKYDFIGSSVRKKLELDLEALES